MLPGIDEDDNIVLGGNASVDGVFSVETPGSVRVVGAFSCDKLVVQAPQLTLEGENEYRPQIRAIDLGEGDTLIGGDFRNVREITGSETATVSGQIIF